MLSDSTPATRPVSALLASILLSATIAFTASVACAQSTDLLKQLNAPSLRINDAGKSATRLFTAYLDLTKPPSAVGPEFGLTTIYPGMEGFAAVSAWAAANANMGKALIAVENCQVLGVPYGTAGVDAKFVEHKLIAEIGVDNDPAKVRFPYLDAIATINAYVAADMYRMCEAGQFDDALKLGLAHLRVLRQGCDASMFDEKSAFMHMVAETLSVHRDILYVYRAKMGTELLRTLATKQYPFLRPSDNERLKRIEMPEGDRLVAESVLASVFAEDGQPDNARFAEVFADLQSDSAPLTAFGATKRWQMIAGVHGSLDASTKKLNDVYDDWWRRWRMRPFDPMMSLPTELSRTNPVKYAAVVLAARDIDALFELRRVLVVELGATVCGCGLSAYWTQFDVWPNDIEKAYAQFFPKRFDFDPYDKDYGRFRYEDLGTRERGVESEYGRIMVPGCILYARNGDAEFNGAARHAVGGKTDDFVVWPPLRALSRGQGK